MAVSGRLSHAGPRSTAQHRSHRSDDDAERRRRRLAGTRGRQGGRGPRAACPPAPARVLRDQQVSGHRCQRRCRAWRHPGVRPRRPRGRRCPCAVDAAGLEVTEAALTGESLPVAKSPERRLTDIGRIVLEGSDVVVGTARAVVVAVGRQTRLGATAAALNVGRGDHSPMARRPAASSTIALAARRRRAASAGLAGLCSTAAPQPANSRSA